jgi:hypothetical protein
LSAFAAALLVVPAAALGLLTTPLWIVPRLRHPWLRDPWMGAAHLTGAGYSVSRVARPRPLDQERQRDDGTRSISETDLKEPS